MANWSELAVSIHKDNIRAGWWLLDKDGKTIPRNIGELLCLVHSEVTEMHVGSFGWVADDHLPLRLMSHVEAADVAIRVCDILGYYCGANLPEPTKPNVMIQNWDRSVLSMHSCISRAMEHFRKGFDERGCAELVALLIRVERLCELRNWDLFTVIEEKREYNRNRLDHKLSARSAKGGKAF